MQLFDARQPNVLARLASKFKLRYPAVVKDLQIPNQIYLVSQLDPLLKNSKAQGDTKDISAGAGTYVPYFIVPAGKRWTLLSLRRSGTTAVTRVQVKVSQTIAVQWWSIAATAEAQIDGYGQVIEEGGTIGLTTTGDGADSAISLHIFYLEEVNF